MEHQGMTAGSTQAASARQAGGKPELDAELARREAEIEALARQQAERASQRRRRRSSGRSSLGLVVASVGGLVVILAGVFFVLHQQSVEQRRQARLDEARQREMEEELAAVRQGQQQLRRLNLERDALIAQLKSGSVKDKAALRKKLAALDAKKKDLEAKLSAKSHRGSHRGRGKGRHGGKATKKDTSGMPATTGPIDRGTEVLPD